MVSIAGFILIAFGAYVCLCGWVELAQAIRGTLEHGLCLTPYAIGGALALGLWMYPGTREYWYLGILVNPLVLSLPVFLGCWVYRLLSGPDRHA